MFAAASQCFRVDVATAKLIATALVVLVDDMVMVVVAVFSCWR